MPAPTTFPSSTPIHKSGHTKNLWPRGLTPPIPRQRGGAVYPVPRGGFTPKTRSSGGVRPTSLSHGGALDMPVSPTAALLAAATAAKTSTNPSTSSTFAFASLAQKTPYFTVQPKPTDKTSPNTTADIARRLGIPSKSTLSTIRLSNTITNLNLSTADINTLDDSFHEQRLAANMTKPPSNIGRSRGDLAATLGFMEELLADSKSAGDGYEFTIVCRATGFSWTVHHDNFTELPDRLERWLVATLATESKTAAALGRPTPIIKTMRLDGHPTQVSRTGYGKLAALEKMLTRRNIHVPPTNTCRPEALARVDRKQRHLDQISKRLLHGQTPKLPHNVLYKYAYDQACSIANILPQSSVPGHKSPFELAYGTAPTLTDIPYPAFGSTAYTRDNQKTGVKQGMHRTGVFVGHKGPDSVAVYLPFDKSVITRNASGVRFNSDFDNFDPIARDRALLRGDPPHLPGPAQTSTAQPVTPALTKDPIYAANTKAEIGALHCLNGSPLPLPFKCNKCEKGFASQRGLRMHHTKCHVSRPLAPPLYSCIADAAAATLPYTEDTSPNLIPAGNWTTLRSFLNITEPPDEQDPDNIDTLQQREHPEVPLEPATPAYSLTENPGYATYTEHKPHQLTPHMAHKYTPTRYSQVLKNPYRDNWLAAITAELNALNRANALKHHKLLHTDRPITLKWVFRIKFHADGTFHKFKARLCARGFTQQAGTDYDPDRISASVGRASTFMTLLAVAAHERHHLFGFDVKGAYLQAKLKEHVVCRLPPGILATKDSDGLLVLKSLYGLRQSGYNWGQKFAKVLKSLGFHQSRVDPCLFTFHRNSDVLRIATWVDDGMVATSSPALWDELRLKIHAITPLQSPDAKPLTDFIGMRVKYDRIRGHLELDHDAKIDAFLAENGMSDCGFLRTPLSSSNAPLDSYPQPDTLSDKRTIAANCGMHSYDELIRKCREAIGFFGYLSCWARPDIRQATYYLARFQARPTTPVWKACKRVMRYLRGNSIPLTFGTRAIAHESPLVGFVDSDYDVYSTSGLAFFVYGCPVLLDSSKQRTVAHSTTEAELIAADRAARANNYLRRLLIFDFGIKNLPITPIYEDNQGCVHISRGGGSFRKLRHIRVAESYVYHCSIIDPSLSLQYIRSRDNVADIFTKACDPDTFHTLRSYLMGNTSYCLTYHPLDSSRTHAGECWIPSSSSEI
jgi:hypothetical protein